MNDLMGNNMDRQLDNYITGYYGEDQFRRPLRRRKSMRSRREAGTSRSTVTQLRSTAVPHTAGKPPVQHTMERQPNRFPCGNGYYNY